MNNIVLGRYIPSNSIIHKLDPRTKFLCLVALLVAIFFPLTLVEYAFLLVTVVTLLLISKIKVNSIFKSLKMMWFMMIFLLVVNIFVIKTGKVLVSFGTIDDVFTVKFMEAVSDSSFNIYFGSILQTVEIFFRLFLMISLTTILTATTKPLEITYAIEYFLKPLKVIHFPVEEIALTISLALRFIPTFLEETQKIMKAQESRGIDFSNGTIKEKIQSIVSLIIPLFVSALQRSDDLANAMEARGYSTETKRTKYRTLSFGIKDLVSFIICGLICFVTIYSCYNPQLTQVIRVWEYLM